MSSVLPEVNPQVELVQVLLYLADRQERTCQNLNNKYYINRIEEYFLPYKNHDAVELTRDLIDRKGFVHIKPLRAILSIEQITNNPENTLHQWAVVNQFKEYTKFDQFFSANKKYYDSIIQKVELFGIGEWITFIEDYFHQTYPYFRLIISPINGNYGFTLDVLYPKTLNTVMCRPIYDENGNLLWQEDLFAKGLAHEYAHCFVNPVVESYKEKLKELKSFFNQHTNKFYNVDYAVMNEYLVRAFAIRFMQILKDKFPLFDVEGELKRQYSQFIYIYEFVKYFEEYEKQSSSFRDFYLTILEDIKVLI